MQARHTQREVGGTGEASERKDGDVGAIKGARCPRKKVIVCTESPGQEMAGWSQEPP